MEKYEDRALLAMLGIGPSGLHGAEGAAVTLQATLSQPSMQPTDFTFRTVAGTAISGADYQEILNGSGTIPPGATFANISIQLFDDYFTEIGETFSVELLTATGATIDPAASSVSVTIDDVESGGGGGGGGSTSLALSVSANVNEGDAFVLTAQMSPAGTYEISAMVDWGVTPGAGPAGFSGTTNADGSFTIGHQYFDDGPAPGNGTPQDVQSITLTGTATQYTPEGPVYYPLSGVTSTTIHNVVPNSVFDVYNYMPIGGPWWVASGTYQDVGLTDLATLEINWGDGSPSIIGSGLEVGDTFWHLHRYPPDGLGYTITMTITDDDMGVVSYSESFGLYLFDLDNDANNSDEINAIDEAFEPPTPGPGRYISVNADDDNENDIPDMNESGPTTGEADLEPFLIRWRGDMRPDINNYYGWHITLNLPHSEPDEYFLNPRIWFNPDKSGTPPDQQLDVEYLGAPIDAYGKEWTIGIETIPEVLYLEARQAGGIGLRLRFWTPNWQEIEEDVNAFTAFDLTADIDIDSNNNDEIEPSDDPIEMEEPGALVRINDDDDNNNGIDDSSDEHLGGNIDADLELVLLSNPPEYVPLIVLQDWEYVLSMDASSADFRFWQENPSDPLGPMISIDASGSGFVWDAADPYLPNHIWLESLRPAGAIIEWAVQLKGSGAKRADKVMVTAPRVISVVFQTYGDNRPIDNASVVPNMPEPPVAPGLRIFPEAKAPDDTVGEAREVVKVFATIAPAHRKNIPVFFTWWDVDDPSATTTPIDMTADGAFPVGVDNRDLSALYKTFPNEHAGEKVKIQNPAANNATAYLTAC